MDANKTKSKQAVIRSGGIIFLTLGIAFFWRQLCARH